MEAAPLHPIKAVEVIHVLPLTRAYPEDARPSRTLYAGTVPDEALAATHTALEGARARCGIRYCIYGVRDPAMWLEANSVVHIDRLVPDLEQMPTRAPRPPAPEFITLLITFVTDPSSTRGQYFRIPEFEHRGVQAVLAKMIMFKYIREVHIVPNTEVPKMVFPADHQALEAHIRSWWDEIRDRLTDT